MDDYINAIIRVKVPKWQIGEEVSVYFPDTMTVRGKCETVPPQVTVFAEDASEKEIQDFKKELEEVIRPQGKWIFHKDYDENCRYGCNQCGNLNNIPSNFCPNCGAYMRGGDKNV